MLFRNLKQATLSLAIIGFLGTAAFDADAQRNTRERAEARKQDSSTDKVEARYPDATRQDPTEKGARKLQAKLQKMVDAYNKDDFPAARSQADEIIASDIATPYDTAVSAQIASQAAYNSDDTPATLTYIQQALDANALDNNNHYQLMYMLAGLQLQEEQYAEGLATLERFMTETKTQDPEVFALKGQGLYQAERFAEAIPALKQAIEASPEPKDNWQQLLMASYAEIGQSGEALTMAETIAARKPGDKKAQMNLAGVYLQADKYEQAAAVLEKLRASGQLTEEKDYRQLYATYANMDGREKEVIGVINDGVSKGVLKPDHQTYLALAQSYYYSEQIPQAIEAWQKAAPLAKDGETYLNLAKVLWQENRLPEAKQAARAAMDKGLKNPDEAKKIIAQP